jgi:AmiR/NasT family two-component response regulator
MLKREFEELERQVKENKQKLEEQNKISEEQDLLIAKLSICAHKCLGPKGAILCQCKH